MLLWLLFQRAWFESFGPLLLAMPTSLRALAQFFPTNVPPHYDTIGEHLQLPGSKCLQTIPKGAQLWLQCSTRPNDPSNFLDFFQEGNQVV